MNGTIGLTSVEGFGFYDSQDGTEKSKIPAIYFENNGANGYYTTIKAGAFWSASEGYANAETSRMILKTIYLPNTITRIEDNAFEGCYYLENVQMPDTTQDGIGVTYIGSRAFDYTGRVQIADGTLSKLTYIGVSAFYKAGDGVYMSEIPKGLKTLNPWSFAYCGNVTIEDFSTVTSMGSNALDTSNKYEMIDIVLPTDLSQYSDNCFSNYAVGRINTITYIGGDYVEPDTLTRLGITASNPVTIEQVIE